MRGESFKDWTVLASEDLDDAWIMFRNGKFAKACYFAQQSVEKLLKAYLIKKGRFDPRIHRTHNLALLLENCIEEDRQFEELKSLRVEELTVYAVGLRYSLKFFEKITESDAIEALKTAEKVRDFVLGKLNIDENRK